MKLNLAVAVLVLAFGVQSLAGAKRTLCKKASNTQQEPEGPDSVPGAPPLRFHDDTDTPGDCGVEVNFYVDCIWGKGFSSCGPVIDANIGIGANGQLKVAKPYSVDKSDGDPTQRGFGPTEIGYKYRFLDDEKSGFSMAIYPNFSMNDATKHKDADGNKIPGEGKIIDIPILAQLARGDYTYGVKTGPVYNITSHRMESVVFSSAVGHSLDRYSWGKNSKVVAEGYTVRNPNNFSSMDSGGTLGYMKVVFDSADFEGSVFISTSKGRIVTDNKGQSYWAGQLGIQIVKKPVR